MALTGRLVDTLILFKIIKDLSTPFNKTDAFKLGIIDENGQVLRRRRTLKTNEEKTAYTRFDTLMFNVKKMIAKIPGGGSRLGSFAAALFLIKEGHDPALQNETILEQRLHQFLDETNILEDTTDILLQELAASANVVGDGTGAIQTPPTSALARVRRKRFAGHDVFEVESHTYLSCKNAKGRYDRYIKHVGDDLMGQAIREYGRGNPGAGIILQDARTGAMTFLRYAKGQVRLG